MFERMARGWSLFKQSWQVLRGNTSLVVFPIFSITASLLVLASFVIPVVVAVNSGSLGGKTLEEWAKRPEHYALVFTFYFVSCFVTTFFNSAIVACTLHHFRGERASVAFGLRAAGSRLPQILGWSLVSATVGVLLKLISDKSALAGKVVSSLLGVVWSVATYLVLPVLVVEGIGPLRAVKRSGELISRSWGEGLTANLAMGAVSAVVALGALLLLGASIGLAVLLQSPAIAAIGFGVMLVALILATLVTSTLQVVLNAAVYWFAVTGDAPAGFDPGVLRAAFKPKS
ncbi:MAG: hypothetical protein JNM07_10375 [Phycisphaerae bacterium]|nr:hypothetical protein [Phycisphaerae bacterium]